ncbi:MAG: GTP-binding protein [Planctomycetales bacterium]|nr:GTP-binding protein [Planctomycetales bacterium]
MNEHAETSSPESPIADDRYQQALLAVERTIRKFESGAAPELEQTRDDVRRLREMAGKLTGGRVEIVIFGEISTGKSAMVNALLGKAVAEVDVQGGWTKEVWQVAWDGCGYRVPGLAQSEVVLVDTPGLNEVGGGLRGEMAREAASRADLILFVTDSNLNETEFSALATLADVNKPIILVLNKVDLYSRQQRGRLQEVLAERVGKLLPPDHVVMTSADPREVEYVIEAADGSTRSEWRSPPPDVEPLKLKILEVLEHDGLALLALNAAMYAADKSDRLAALRVKLRTKQANQVIWSYAAVKAMAVGLNTVPVVDTMGGFAVDVTMVGTLAHIYGLEMSWKHARQLVTSIVKAAGWVMLGEASTHVASWVFNTLTVGFGKVLTAVPQGAAAGYGSYIVGQAARYYFEHGASWGGESPKTVVHRILETTDKQSVLQHLKEEIRNRLHSNPHAESK